MDLIQTPLTMYFINNTRGLGNFYEDRKYILTRFCIDEDAAFELSGVNYLKKNRPTKKRLRKASNPINKES